MKNIEKYYGEQWVLKDLNLSIEKGQFITLLGPSGCGKSTLLRILAGLESLSSGSIYLDGEDITWKSPQQRNIGMIFQQYSLFPTMNVYNNVAFGLKMKKMKKDEIASIVAEALRIVDLKGCEKKYPSQLSGGEQQRVALARAIVTRPKVLLLDEPFSAIDAKLRKALQERIKEIHQELGMTSIFVTHDQDEAMTMSDVIHLMNNGVIEQTAEPIKLYSQPQTLFAASFMGNYNILDGSNLAKVAGWNLANKKIAIRPELIAIAKEPFATSENSICLTGTILDRIPQGNIIRYKVAVGKTVFKVDILFDQGFFFNRNEQVYLEIKRDSILEY